MKHHLASLKLALAALLLNAQPSFAVDLIDAYNAALKADPTLLAAEAEVEAGREKRVQGNALLLPQINVTGTYQHIDNSTDTGLPPEFADLIKSSSQGQVQKGEVQLKQPLYDAGAWAERKQLLRQTDLAEITYRNAQQELIQRVSEAYLNVLLAQEALRVAQAEKAAVGLQRDRAQARFEVGRSKITDVQESQARYDSVLTNELSTESTLALRQAQYQELTGLPPENLAELAPEFPLTPPQPDSLPTWQSRGLDRSPRVLVKQNELLIASADIDKYRLLARPTLELQASYSDQSQNGSLSPTIAADRNKTGVVGVELSVPLFAGGSIDSKRREAVSKERQAQRELDATQRDIRLQVQDSFLAVKTGVARVKALQQSVLSEQTALEATTLGRDIGSRTESDVLDAQQRLFSTQLDLAQARSDYLLGRIKLALAVGDLQLGDLQILNACLAK